MIDFIKKSLAVAFGIVSGIFTFVPESFFEKHQWVSKEVIEQSKWFARLDILRANVIISRLICFLLVLLNITSF